MIFAVDGVTDNLTNGLGNINFPAVALLASSGVVALIFIARWMVRFQREFTNFYIDENTKLRHRIDEMETEIESKDGKFAKAMRDQLSYERESHVRIRALENTIAQHELTIQQHELTIQQHERTIEELRRRG